MPQALLDTSVLFAAAYQRDGAHTDGLAIMKGIDDGSPPEAVVLDFVLAETLNGLTTHAGHDAAVDLLDRIEENAQFTVATIASDDFATAKALFRRHRPFSLVDASIVAFAQTEGIEYLYAFDGDFDAANGLSRLAAATNPYDPT